MGANPCSGPLHGRHEDEPERNPTAWDKMWENHSATEMALPDFSGLQCIINIGDAEWIYM